MRIGEVTVIEWEHPDHGLVRVFWRVVAAKHGGLTCVPTAVEFDLFTPASEQARMTEELLAIRVDRSVSVSA